MTRIQIYTLVILIVGCVLVLPTFPEIAQRMDQGLQFVYFGSQGGNELDTTKTGCYIGTMGCMVTNGTEDYILSNNHVLARSNQGVVGEDILHLAAKFCDPSPLHIGELAHYIPISFNRRVANYVDAAIARITPYVKSDGLITGNVSGDFFYAGGTPKAADIGLFVMKSGRTTGLTYGTIADVNVNVSVNYGRGIANFRDQIIIIGTNGSFSEGGDSGSLIVTQQIERREGNHNYHAPVGLLFAGNSSTTIANPIESVLLALGDNFYIGCSGEDGVDNLENPGDGGSTPPGKGNKNNTKSSLVHPDIAIATAARDLHEEKIMNIGGVHGSGIGLDENGRPIIDVFVQTLSPKIRALIPAQMDSIPVRLIEMDEFVAY